jgi:hypothetical protein
MWLSLEEEALGDGPASHGQDDTPSQQAFIGLSDTKSPTVSQPTVQAQSIEETREKTMTETLSSHMPETHVLSMAVSHSVQRNR